ncbi:neurogenic locus notch homolog protein 1-like [Mercenaria mercenaria]|uniref:neurogenic locus notch homolog protein 1-like n=1 Tax=Mercenaria mercenaria TaxID=6596 RepID=UPI00234F3302|nr:neurogenic locus notch homolog protein 1-like [Mercenaria mercenaria]
MDIIFAVIQSLVILLTVCEANVIVGVTIQSYSNPNGTCYVESSSDRKCCDGIQRSHCELGDTCDTYFDICVGRMEPNWGCKGAFFQTKPLNNTNSIANLSMMESKSDFWEPGMSIFIFVRDDDSHGIPVIKKHDHIDTLIEELKFVPSPTQDGAPPHPFEWQGKTRLSVSVSVWCDNHYYGQYCRSYCKGISTMAVCESSGKLSCQPSDALLLEFKNQTSQNQLPDIDLNAHRFIQGRVCQGETLNIQYPALDTNSNTFTFIADCGSHQITPIEFDSILKLQKPSTLDNYFSAGVITGPSVILTGYGEHIVPNVYIGVEIKALDNPTGTSYDGELTTGERRCCDVPKGGNCATADDLCDLQVSVCIGEIQQSVCIGAVTLSPTYTNTSSISTCGPTLLDLTNNVATVSHPMVGGLRLTKNIASVKVVVKDSDLNGNASDIIDVLSKNITVNPGPNVTYAKSIDITMTNIASVTLRLIFWCAPGHSGPLCHADVGTDTCEPGWYGNECEIPLSACSPNPCKHGGQCNLLPNNGFNCTCDPGYNGSSCEQDVDECALHICQNNATCKNTNGAFSCICPSLWTGLICTEDRVPACDPNPCSNGKCVVDESQKEGFRCNCVEGWTGIFCNEKNECEHGDAHVINGVETCICHEGFSGSTCNKDINECLAKPCQNGGYCKNLFGNFSCICGNGYSGNRCQNITGACIGIQCQNNGSCLDIGGARFICMCDEDFTGDYCETKITNRCEKVTCDNNGTCYDSFHDFMCNCTQFWSGKTCDNDVNECVKSVCKNGGICQNTIGSFHCDCQYGWTGSDCSSDIDECASPSQFCKYGNCSNLPGSYKCSCRTGFSGPHCLMKSLSCINVTCSGHGKCRELINGYDCNCDAGYTGADCETDVDECSHNICGSHASSCSNEPGSYNCTCISGWQGQNCLDDVDECSSTLKVPCSGNGICTNIPGSYHCTCFPGFSGNDCSVFLNICEDLKCRNNGTCFVKHSESKCTCSSGWTGIKCEDDVNECETLIPCKNSGICQNTDGSYYCRCFSGWTGKTCETDVNECLSSVCKNAGICSNTPGSFNCACQTGWIGMTCEIQKTKTLAGELISFLFEKNISRDLVQPTLSFTYKFLEDYVFNSSHIYFHLQRVHLNNLQFKAKCNGNSVSKELITSALHKIPNDTLSHLFPSALIGIQEINQASSSTSSVSNTSYTSTPNTSSTSSRKDGQMSTLKADSSSSSKSSKSWVTDYWPVVAGSGSAFVIIVIVLVLGLYIFRRSKQRLQENSFANPSYTTEMLRYDD